VLGTTGDYFEHFRYARGRPLTFASGRPFHDSGEAVMGADVARSLGYDLGQEIVLAHGSGDVAFLLHKDQPFRVAGILASTGTPADRTIHVSLEGLDALHDNERAAAADPLQEAARQEAARDRVHTHERTEHVQGENDHVKITAFLVGLKSRGAALAFQRRVNEFAAEPLTAILPGATLLEVWSIVGVAERALFAVSVLVIMVGLCGMLVALLTSLSERRREMAVLRSVGARPLHVFTLIVGEAALLTLLGIAIGVAAVEIGLWAADHWFPSALGFVMDGGGPTARELALLILVAAAGALVGMIPAYRIYRLSLTDGMAIRL
jgi:putative ABC transport system permease protein